MQKTPANIVVGRFFGRMIDNETRRLSRSLQQAIARMGSVRLLLALETVGGADHLMEGLHFVRLHADHIERIAIVGNRSAIETQVGLFGLFGGVNIAYFDRSRFADAVRWLEAP